jgi:dTDP-4-amino-4,6-dideoxygalactose transaminase
MIPFNKPYLTGREIQYMTQAASSGKISGNGEFTGRCHDFFEKRYGFRKVLLTTSCTDALEMCAILLNIRPGDEVIIPSFTFVSTANAFVLRGASIRFADSAGDSPNIDAGKIEELINERTRAIVVVHYAGMSCDMDKITDIALRHNLFVVEDAAQSVDSYYCDRPLGSIGHLAAFSFHETKNVIAGEGGMLVINDESFIDRAEIIWEKGTNRAAFYRGEVNTYGWFDIGSSFLPSEITAAFLLAQLEHLDDIQRRRKYLWNYYHNKLGTLETSGMISYIKQPPYATNNAHLYYFITRNLEERTGLIAHLKKNNIQAIFHYLPLHQSSYFKGKHDGRALPNAIRYSDRIIRLPFYYELSTDEIDYIAANIKKYYM